MKLLVAGCSERAGSDELYSFPSARGVVSCFGPMAGSVAYIHNKVPIDHLHVHD